MLKKLIASVLVLGALVCGGVVMGDSASAGIIISDHFVSVVGR